MFGVEIFRRVSEVMPAGTTCWIDGHPPRVNGDYVLVGGHRL